MNESLAVVIHEKKIFLAVRIGFKIYIHVVCVWRMYLHFVGKEVLTLSEKNGLGVRLSKCTAGCYTLCANTSFNTLYYITISLIVRIDYITTTM